MAAKNTKCSVLAARCTKALKKRISDAGDSTGLNEAEFILASIDEFFQNHKTPAEKIAAFQAYRLKQAQG